jgi:hypothetical protein
MFFFFFTKISEEEMFDGHKVLKEGLFVTQLANNAGISV